MEHIVLICHMWNARRKARIVAETEAYYLLQSIKPQVLRGGPLSEKRGIFWISIPRNALGIAKKKFNKLGYTQKIDVPILVPDNELPPDPQKSMALGELIRWRKQFYKLIRVYEGDIQTMLNTAPDQREFMLKLFDGEIRPIKGYRGDGKALSRRGLPPHDARMLVNVVRTETKNAVFLDPFAGVGGVVLEAIKSSYRVFSSDNDPFLMHGLSHFGALHCIADARQLPYSDESIDAIATEPPYDKNAGDLVTPSLIEMTRVLKFGSRVVIFCAAWQADSLRKISQSLKLENYLDAPVNRKGTACVVLAWVKIGDSKCKKST